MPLEKASAIHASRLDAVQKQLAALWPTWPQEITFEIGCGHGHFLTSYAQAHPDEFCLGIDIIADRVERAKKKAVRSELRNIAFLHAEAGLLLEALAVTVKFRRIFVLFPDPWPKRRHQKNRLMQTVFLQKLAGRAGERTLLYFRTDFVPYYRETMAMLKTHSTWRLSEEAWPFEHETVFQSRSETHHSCIAQYRAPKQ